MKVLQFNMIMNKKATSNYSPKQLNKLKLFPVLNFDTNKY